MCQYYHLVFYGYHFTGSSSNNKALKKNCASTVLHCRLLVFMKLYFQNENENQIDYSN